MTKIMLVEDDNNLREIYEARLSAEGYEIVSAENGEAALAMAAKERPDMIISDVMMPKISGFEMLDILRNTNSLKDVKIIMLTALGQAEDSQRADQLGADRYLVKSQVTLEDIVKATHDLLDDPNKPTNLPEAEATADAVAPAAVEAVAQEPAAQPAPAAPAQPVQDVPITPGSDTAADDGGSALPVADPVSENVANASTDLSDVVAPADAMTPAPEAAGEESATPEIVAPVPSEPVASNAVSEASEPAAVTPEPNNAPSVISIPVSDGVDDATDNTQSAADASSATATITPITVVEPPAEPEINLPAPEPATPASNVQLPTAQAPNAATSTETAAPVVPASEEATADYTSPDNFNNFQAPATVPAEPTVPTDDVARAETPSEANQSSTPSAPPVEIPSLMPVSDMPPASDLDEMPVQTEGPADPMPQPEALDNFSAPVISAPDSATTASPADSANPTEPAAPAAPDSVIRDDQLREAAADLAESASEATTPSSDASNRLKVISPLPADETKPSIHQLLAVEEAKNGAQQAVQATQQPAPNVNAYNPAAAPQVPQPATDEPDPNSISL